MSFFARRTLTIAAFVIIAADQAAADPPAGAGIGAVEESALTG
jgi:hypothetical protein